MTKKNKVRSYYDQYSSQYDTFYQPIQFDKFQHIRSYLDTNSPVIYDLGGGTGITSQWLDCFVINLDISYDMITKGLQTRDFNGIAADLEHLPLRNQSISVFISLTAIQNVDNPKMALAELVRSISLHGTGVITILNKLISKTTIENIFSELSINYEYIPFNGEDICYLIH